MDRTMRQQVASGLRIGAGLGFFLIAAMLMGNGMRRILGSVGSHQIAWSDWMGWAELMVAAVILLLTARAWLLLLGGCLLFGLLKGLIVFATGSFSSHGFSTRVEPLAVAFYCLATLVLMFRFAEIPPTVLDRVALTMYLFCLWPAASSSTFSWWQGVGLAALLVSWCVSRWRGRNRTAGICSG